MTARNYVDALSAEQFIDALERALPVGPSQREDVAYLRRTVALIERQLRELENRS